MYKSDKEKVDELTKELMKNACDMGFFLGILFSLAVAMLVWFAWVMYGFFFV